MRTLLLALGSLLLLNWNSYAVLGEDCDQCKSTYTPEFGTPLSSPPNDKALIYKKDAFVLLVGFDPQTQLCQYVALKGERGATIPQSMIEKLVSINGKNVGGFRSIGTGVWMAGDEKSIAAIKEGTLIIGTPPGNLR